MPGTRISRAPDNDLNSTPSKEIAKRFFFIFQLHTSYQRHLSLPLSGTPG
jgi:hypothetical protein